MAVAPLLPVALLSRRRDGASRRRPDRGGYDATVKKILIILILVAIGIAVAKKVRDSAVA
jgi:hypothetical protein